MSLTIEAVTPKFELTEGPFWDVDEQCLYFVDVRKKCICKYIPSTNTFSKAVIPNSNSKSRVSFVIPVKDQKNNFVIACGGEILKIKWDGISTEFEILETIVDLKSVEAPTAQWNDAKIDSTGQLWAGYVIPGGALYVLKAGGLYTVNLSKKTLKKQLSEEISLANGMGWNKNDSKFYFADSLENELLEFDCNLDSAEIKNKKVFFKCSASGKFPDGMTVDANDNLWVATFTKNVVNIDSKKPNTVLQTVELPVAQVTSCTFGGSKLDELYVTTASVAWAGDKPDGGCVYRIKGLNIQGTASHKAMLN